VSRKSVTKLPQKSMLREFAKASEAEIWTRVCRRYFTSFAGLNFKNEPGLTELNAAESRRDKLSRRIRRSESANLPCYWARRQTAYARFYRHERIMISTLFASSKFVTNRNHFQVITETGLTGQLHYDGMANCGHRFRPEDRNELDFSEHAMLFYAQESTTWMTRNITITFHRIPARWFMCPLISTSLRMSSALWASAGV